MEGQMNNDKLNGFGRSMNYTESNIGFFKDNQLKGYGRKIVLN